MRWKLRNKTSNAGARRSEKGQRVGRAKSSATPIWEAAEELAAQVPESEWRKVPSDLARNLHHYLHGGSKEGAE